MRTNLRRIVDAQYINGLYDAAMKALTNSHLVNTCALMFGASNTLIGYLSGLPSFSIFSSLFSSIMIEKGKSARKITIWTSLLARPFWFLSAIAILCFPQSFSLTFFVVSFTMGWIINGIAGGGFWPWFKQLLPHRIGAKILAIRIQGILMVKLILLMIVGLLISKLTKTEPEKMKYLYASIFISAGIFGLLATQQLNRIKQDAIFTRHFIPFRKKLLITFRKEKFRQLLKVVSSLSFISSFFMSFSSVFLITQCGIPSGRAILWITVTQIMEIPFTRLFSHKYKGSSIILTYGYILLILSVIALWSFSVVPFILILGVSAIVYGGANAAMNLGMTEALIFSVPNKLSSIYISVAHTIRYASGAVGAFLAGIILDLSTWSVYFLLTIIFQLICARFLYSFRRINIAKKY